MERILSLDPGTKRIGVAISTDISGAAEELGTYPNNRNFWPTLAKFTTEKHISKIVVGNPRQLDGSRTAESTMAEAFAERASRETGVETILEDESATTAEAEERLRAQQLSHDQIKERIHSMSAVVILEGYLASQAT